MPTPNPPSYSICGRNEHVGFFCDRTFAPDVRPGALLSTTGGNSSAPAGIPIGVLKSIRDNTELGTYNVVKPYSATPPTSTVHVLLYTCLDPSETPRMHLTGGHRHDDLR